MTTKRTVTSSSVLRLTDSEKQTILTNLRIAFADFYEFDRYAKQPLQYLLNHIPSSLHINTNTILKDNGVDKSIFRTKEEKKIQDMVRTVLACCHVILFDQLEESLRYKWTFEQLFEAYPSFRQLELSCEEGGLNNRNEVSYLLNYRNYLVLSLQLLPPHRNKGVLIQIASRLEGSKELYVLGSGQKDAATRREDIYYQESGMPRPNAVLAPTIAVPAPVAALAVATPAVVPAIPSVISQSVSRSRSTSTSRAAQTSSPHRSIDQQQAAIPVRSSPLLPSSPPQDLHQVAPPLVHPYYAQMQMQYPSYPLNPAAPNYGLMSRSVDRSGSLEGESFSTASTPIAVTHAPIQQDPRFASVPVDDPNAMDFDGLDEDLCSLNFDLLDTQTAEALLANEDDYAAGEFTEQARNIYY